jgi:uncharacterized membrane protein YeaQ/YmgE (transglycosylase-associated protein family)
MRQPRRWRDLFKGVNTMGVIGALLLIALIFVAINVIQWTWGILVAVIIWAITGALASRIMGGDGTGILGNVLLGVIGGAVGSIVLGLLNLRGAIGDIWLVGPILVGIVGAVIVIAIARAVGFKGFGV